jgi:hypothetical protein
LYLQLTRRSSPHHPPRRNCCHCSQTASNRFPSTRRVPVPRPTGINMKRSNKLLRFVVVTMVLFIGGCAPAYHSYSGCGVACQYCPRRPLPYASYCGSACHSYQAEPHLVSRSEAAATCAPVRLPDPYCRPSAMGEISQPVDLP